MPWRGREKIPDLEVLCKESIMSFSINTNITSMQAQEYLRVTSDFQSKTLNKVTSGLRIVQSGDDAAGLAIANTFRSDQAVLSQGVRNANDGLSMLQTIDGGMSNISKLLDRARTLATQSASGTFTGDRSVLNSEFQSVMQEINRQAQAVGMNKGGTFANNLSAFVGGGKGSSDSAVITNGSVGVDLSKSNRNAKSLGLDAYRSMNSRNYDLGVTSDTSVAKIIANEGSATAAVFSFRGAGYGDSSTQIDVSVSTKGLTDSAGLAAAINQAIYNKANPGASVETDASKAFKAAGIAATVVTDASGHEKLAFTSSNAAFQVHGDQLANAFLGNISDSSVGNVSGEGATYVKADSSLQTLTADLAAGSTLEFLVVGAAASNGIDLTVALDTDGGVAPLSATDIVTKLNTALAGGDATEAKFTAYLKDGKLAFTNIAGEDAVEFSVFITNTVPDDTTATALGFDATTASSSYNGLNSGGVYLSAQEKSIDSADDHSNDAFKFTALTGDQTITVNATRADGTVSGLDIKLDDTTAADVNSAIDEINQKLQGSEDSVLKNIVAVRDGEGVRFMSTEGFSVSLGTPENDDEGLSESVTAR